MAEIGTIIENKYEILTEIGRGGMSVVYLAMDRRLNKQWAVKEIKKQVNDINNDVVVQSLVTEANLMKKLDHPALPRIVDIIDDNRTIYVVMDYIEGTSLDKVLAERGVIDQHTVIEWAKVLCDAMNYLHTRKPPIIYRDMKPANVMLKPEGTLKIIDFGIAREYKEENVADTKWLGTRGYAAPEQFGGSGQTDGRTDIYNLGVTLYHLVTGKNPTEPPYVMYPIRYWNPALSGGLEQIILKCTQPNPEKRYQNCDELMYALEHYEEIDEKFIRKQKKKIASFALLLMSSMVLITSGFMFNNMASDNQTAEYREYISDGDREVNNELRQKAYINAIAVMPGNTEAYIKLIKSYKENGGKYTIDESDILSGLVKKNQEALKKDINNYVNLCYEIGKLYWFHYSYGNTKDNQITRMQAAIPWFEDVVTYSDSENIDFEYYNMAKIFRDIGIFNRDYVINIQEASGKGTYAEYFRQIKQLEEFIAEDNENDEIVVWEVYRLIAYSLETYMQKFSSDGIAREEVLELAEKVRKQVAAAEATVDTTIELKKYAQGILDENGTIKDKINAAYN